MIYGSPSFLLLSITLGTVNIFAALLVLQKVFSAAMETENSYKI